MLIPAPRNTLPLLHAQAVYNEARDRGLFTALPLKRLSVVITPEGGSVDFEWELNVRLNNRLELLELFEQMWPKFTTVLGTYNETFLTMSFDLVTPKHPTVTVPFTSLPVTLGEHDAHKS